MSRQRKAKLFTTPEMLEDCKKKPRQQAKKKKHQRNAEKIIDNDNVINIKNHEEQEDMEIIREKAGGCNIYHTLRKTYDNTKKETWLLH